MIQEESAKVFLWVIINKRKDYRTVCDKIKVNWRYSGTELITINA
jgi:hypothetical protein